MKKILFIIFFIFIFQSWPKADDISEFEVEGISIGDSLLDYYSEDEIKSNAKPVRFGGKDYFEWKKIVKKKNNELYESVVLIFKANDKKYIIKNIDGRNYYDDNIGKCYNVQNSISAEIEEIMPNANKKGPTLKKMLVFPDGNSYARYIDFMFNDGSYSRIGCLDFSTDDTKSRDRLSVMIGAKDYSSWVHSNVIK